jgi:hypothetical protein
MAWRRFVVEPAAEIAPSMVHPTIGWTMSRLLEHLNTSLPYVAITGPAAVGKGRLARRLVHERNRRRVGSARLIADPCEPAGQTSSTLLVPPASVRRTVDVADSAPEESRGADWPSNAWRGEIELIRRRARLLAKEMPVWRWPDGLAISDFWLDQSLAYLKPLAEAADSAGAEGPLEGLRAQIVPVVRPKLLVVLGSAADRLGLALAELARRPGRGPALLLKDPDLDRAAEEVLAAIDAMA